MWACIEPERWVLAGHEGRVGGDPHHPAIEADGDIQAVLVDDKLYSLAEGKNNGGRKKLQMSALELVQRITRFRPELDVYILIAQEKEDDVVDALFTEAVDGYFYREERDYRGMYRILNAQIQERARTPFYDQLKKNGAEIHLFDNLRRTFAPILKLFGASGGPQVMNGPVPSGARIAVSSS